MHFGNWTLIKESFFLVRELVSKTELNCRFVLNLSYKSIEVQSSNSIIDTTYKYTSEIQQGQCQWN